MTIKITRHFGGGRRITVSPLNEPGVVTSISLSPEGKLLLQGWRFDSENTGPMDDEALAQASYAAIEVMRAVLDTNRPTVLGGLLPYSERFG